MSVAGLGDGPPRVALGIRLLVREMPDLGYSAAHGGSHYRCFLPDLAGFTGFRRTEPEI